MRYVQDLEGGAVPYTLRNDAGQTVVSYITETYLGKYVRWDPPCWKYQKYI